jgi:hypothetical protein
MIGEKGSRAACSGETKGRLLLEFDGPGPAATEIK